MNMNMNFDNNNNNNNSNSNNKYIEEICVESFLCLHPDICVSHVGTDFCCDERCTLLQYISTFYVGSHGQIHQQMFLPPTQIQCDVLNSFRPLVHAVF